jgi:hypothetical protein
MRAGQRAGLAFERRCPVMHAGTFERVETLDSGPAITCAAGDDDRSRTDSLTVGQLQCEVAGTVRLRTQRAHFIRDRPERRFCHSSACGDGGRKAAGERTGDGRYCPHHTGWSNLVSAHLEIFRSPDR